MQDTAKSQTIKEETDDIFLGPIYTSNVSVVQQSGTKWTRSVEMNQQEVSFKIDTGANINVHVMSESY